MSSTADTAARILRLTDSVRRRLADIGDKDAPAENQCRYGGVSDEWERRACAAESVSILAWLYGSVMRVNAASPSDESRDRFVLSKISSATALYAVLAELGFFSTDELREYCRMGSMLPSAPDFRRTPGVDVSCGLPGMGIGIALGLSLALGSLDPLGTLVTDVPGPRVFCLIGAEELRIGAAYESLRLAAEAAPPNLTVIVEAGASQPGLKEPVLKTVISDSRDNTASMLSAMGCHVVKADGNDPSSLDAAMRELTDGVLGAALRVIAAEVKMP